MAKRKNKHPEIGTTFELSVVRRYKTYDLVDRTWADGDGGQVTTRDYRTKSGFTIDVQSRRGRMPWGMRNLLNREIQPEPARRGQTHCSIGRAPDGTWYGWSHRAIVGFKPGRDCMFDARRIKDDTPFQRTTDRLIRTDWEARECAKRFSRFVS